MSGEDLRSEIAAIKKQMTELQMLVKSLIKSRPHREFTDYSYSEDTNKEQKSNGFVYYTGQYQANGQLFRLEPKESQIEQLLLIGTEKLSKILSALGSKPRLDILITALFESLTGAEMVEKLNMGTTGQLYHHLKALQGADLLTQDKNGRYTLPDHRKLPLILLLSAVADMLDTSNYIDMVEVRNSASDYLGYVTKDGFDANLLLWAVVENSILEHIDGFTTEIHIFLHEDGSATVNDNGRGIPVNTFQNSHKSNFQTVLTDINRFNKDAGYQAPGAGKGISIAIVNALTYSLSVEVKREGYIYRQDYKHGIPQSELNMVGITHTTGTSITFRPDSELFSKGFNRDSIHEQLKNITLSYPNLSIQLY